MFGLSTELITKRKLATVKGYCSSSLFTMANLPLAINFIDETKHSY